MDKKLIATVATVAVGVIVAFWAMNNTVLGNVVAKK